MNYKLGCLLQRTAHKLLAGDSYNLHTTANSPKIQSFHFLIHSLFQLSSFSTPSVCLGAGMIDPLCKHHCQGRHNLLKLSIGSCCVLCLGISQAKPAKMNSFLSHHSTTRVLQEEKWAFHVLSVLCGIINSCLGNSAHPVEVFGLDFLMIINYKGIC